MTNIKPIITATLDAGQVTVGWTKQGMDVVEIFVDRGDGKGFVFLAVDTVPDYTDTLTRPLVKAPSGNTTIYHQGDDRSANGVML